MLTELLHKALLSRADLLISLESEGTDCYRLFHGVNEGRPGLSIDAYGPLTLVQVAERFPLKGSELDELESYCSAHRAGPIVIAERSGPKLKLLRESMVGAWSGQYWGRELGLEFAINLKKAHRDPQLFLDFRAAKREICALLRERSGVALNLFAYTCSVGCHCAQLGAEVVNVDFSGGNLRWGQKNFRRNRLLSTRAAFLDRDCLEVLWSLNRKKGSPQPGQLGLTVDKFDLVVVDPPAWSKGKFATVDLVRDPETVFAPAWRTVAPGGVMVAANNSAKMSKQEFQSRLQSLFSKAGEGHQCQDLRWVAPDLDFPSRDGEHPLKVAFALKE